MDTHTGVLGSGHSSCHPFKPSIIPFSWGSVFCAEEVPGGWERSVGGGMCFSLSFQHSWDYETSKGTCVSQDNVSITACACSAGAGAALQSIPVTLGSRCHLPASVFKDHLPPFHQLGVEWRGWISRNILNNNKSLSSATRKRGGSSGTSRDAGWSPGDLPGFSLLFFGCCEGAQHSPFFPVCPAPSGESLALHLHWLLFTCPSSSHSQVFSLSLEIQVCKSAAYILCF